MRSTAKYIAIIAAILMLLCGCEEKSFENKNLTIRGASNFDMPVGESMTLTVELPENKVKPTLSASVDRQGLSVEVSDNNEVTITAEQVGDYNITFTLSAKGYKSADAVFPAYVYPNDLPLTILANGEDITDRLHLSLDYKEAVEIELINEAENTELSFSTPDSDLIEISESGGSYTVTGKAAGTATLYITPSSDNYNDFSLPVEVEKISPGFTVSAGSAQTLVGKELIFQCQYPQDCTITANVVPKNADVKVENGQITVTSSVADSYNITIFCEGENYLKEYETVTAVFGLPSVYFSAPASVTIQSGDNTVFSLSDYPAGTSFSVTSVGKAAATISGNQVTVSAKAAGSDTLVITAKAPGYQSSSVRIPVTINAVTVNVSDKYDDEINEIIRLVNKERTSRGLSSLKYLAELAPGCTIRAKECSKQWSHTRLDGDNWETVLYDTGVNFISGGENLLEMNALNPQEAVNAWMNSPGHKANILRPNFSATCVAIYKNNGNYYYAQHFIER